MTNLRRNLDSSDNQSSVEENWESNSIQDLKEWITKHNVSETTGSVG